MFPECFDPAYAKAALLLMENQGVKDGDEVLVQFSGPGLDARLAYENGASQVVSVEKFELPWMCARYNTLRAGLDGVIDNRLGDLFDPIEEGEKFDLILANPPFREMQPKTNVESAIRDDGYDTLQRFWNEVDNYLKPNGRVRTVFSNVGSLNHFYSLAGSNGFGWQTMQTAKYASKVSIEVSEFKRYDSDPLEF